jgi:hypothetical protein
MKLSGIIPLQDRTFLLTMGDAARNGKGATPYWSTRRVLTCQLVVDLMSLLDLEQLRETFPTFNAVRCLVYNMAVSDSLGENGVPCPIAVSRKAERYVDEPIGYTPMMRVLDAAEKAGLIVQVRGSWSDSLRTEVVPTSKLQLLLQAAKDFEFEDLYQKELIVLRDKIGRDVEVPDTLEVRQLRTNLEQINASARQFAWSHDGHTIASADLVYHRVFNETFGRGGRFYTSGKAHKRAFRQSLAVDGEPTVEVDFRSMHPRMLYHERNLAAPADAYDYPVPGLEGLAPSDARAIRKSTLTIALYCKKIQKPPRALQGRLEEKGIVLPDGVSPEDLLHAAEEAHQPILDSFYKGESVRLQYLDSVIAEEVMLKFVGVNRPCLCIHDSFLVKQADEELLTATMFDAYRRVMKHEPLTHSKRGNAHIRAA